jgi:crotonobetainyl-CoA:carnitine CoA-transferase CaiB-like acyl-CoA transferase
MTGVLEGLKVLEMGHVVAVPAAGATMADWGAEVIKVEPLTGEMARNIPMAMTPEEKAWVQSSDYVNWYFQFLNRGKKGIALNLRTEAGKTIMHQLVEWADIFMSNYEVGSLDRLGMDYESLKEINPRMIYAVLTGYGTVGPDKNERGFDFSAAWARPGIMYMIGEPGSIPSPQRGGMMDRTVGSHMVGGVLAALYHRDRTGEGQKLEFSLYHSGVWTLAEDIQPCLINRPPVKHQRTLARSPLWNNYRTKDDRWFWAAMLQSDLSWGDFCRALSRPEWEKDPRFDSIENRHANREPLIGLIDEVLATKTLAEWEEVFRKHNVIYGRVQTPMEVVADPQALANDFFVDLHHPTRPETKTVMTPVKFVQNPAAVKSCAPELGQHTEEVLRAIGYEWEEIAHLRDEGTIR